MSLRKMVVKGKVKQPNQMGFKLSTWEECYKNLTDPSGEDRSLLNAGVWFHQNFVHFRKLSSEVEIPKYSRSKLTLAILGSANRGYSIEKEQMSRSSRLIEGKL